MKEYFPQFFSDCYKTLFEKDQRVLVLLSDEDYFKRKRILFQKNRLYKIKQLEEDGRLKLVHHLFSSEPKITHLILLKETQIVIENLYQN